MTTQTIRTAGRSEADQCIAVMLRAFSQDPAARWMYPDREQYQEYFPRFVRAFGGAAFEHNTGQYVDGFLASALWLPPGVLPPDGDFHFHRGPRYASEYLGYDAAELSELPEIATARFAGVGNPHRIDTIVAGETVLDHACGAGMDLLIAARRTGPGGHAIGIDLTPAMRDCAERAAEQAGLGERVEILAGSMEALPVPDASVDVVISNGVVNLAPDKRQVFREIYRVLKPGGRLMLADVVVARELKSDARENPDLWAACIAGALTEPEIMEISYETGFWGGSITERFDCFRNTSAEAKVSRDLQVHAINFFAAK